MTTSKDYIWFVCDCLNGRSVGNIQKNVRRIPCLYKRNAILLVCDNTVFVKKLPETAELMRDCSEGYPYDGARANYIPHIENRDLLYKAVTALERITPVPKRRKK